MNTEIQEIHHSESLRFPIFLPNWWQQTETNKCSVIIRFLPVNCLILLCYFGSLSRDLVEGSENALLILFKPDKLATLNGCIGVYG